MLLLCLAEFCVVLVTLQFSRKVVVVLGGGVDLMWEQLNSLLISLGRRVWGSYTHFDPMYGPVLWSCPGASALSTSLSCRLITFRICTNTMTSHLLLSSQEKGAGQYWYRTTPVIYVNNVILMLQFFLVLVTSNSNKIAVSRVWKSVCVGDRSCVLASVSTHDLRHWLGCHCHFRLNSHSECGKFSSVGEIQRGVDWDVRLQLYYDSFEMMIAMLISIGEYRM